MVAKGEVPMWDVEGKKWTSNTSSEVTIKGGSKSQDLVPVDPQSDDVPDDELPF